MSAFPRLDKASTTSTSPTTSILYSRRFQTSLRAENVSTTREFRKRMPPARPTMRLRRREPRPRHTRRVLTRSLGFARDRRWQSGLLCGDPSTSLGMTGRDGPSGVRSRTRLFEVVLVRSRTRAERLRNTESNSSRRSCFRIGTPWLSNEAPQFAIELIDGGFRKHGIGPADGVNDSL
jgi:hypothetical protein